jgi:ribosomal protein S4
VSKFFKPFFNIRTYFFYSLLNINNFKKKFFSKIINKDKLVLFLKKFKQPLKFFNFYYFKKRRLRLFTKKIYASYFLKVKRPVRRYRKFIKNRRNTLTTFKFWWSHRNKFFKNLFLKIRYLKLKKIFKKNLRTKLKKKFKIGFVRLKTFFLKKKVAHWFTKTKNLKKKQKMYKNYAITMFKRSFKRLKLRNKIFFYRNVIRMFNTRHIYSCFFPINFFCFKKIVKTFLSHNSISYFFIKLLRTTRNLTLRKKKLKLFKKKLKNSHPLLYLRLHGSNKILVKNLFQQLFAKIKKKYYKRFYTKKFKALRFYKKTVGIGYSLFRDHDYHDKSMRTLKKGLKFYYGRLKKRSYNKFFTNVKKKLKKYKNLYTFFYIKFESFLPNILYRLKIIHIQYLAPYCITHGFVAVNGRVITYTNFYLNVGDYIAVTKQLRNLFKRSPIYFPRSFKRKRSLDTRLKNWFKRFKRFKKYRKLRFMVRSRKNGLYNFLTFYRRRRRCPLHYEYSYRLKIFYFAYYPSIGDTIFDYLDFRSFKLYQFFVQRFIYTKYY